MATHQRQPGTLAGHPELPSCRDQTHDHNGELGGDATGRNLPGGIKSPSRRTSCWLHTPHRIIIKKRCGGLVDPPHRYPDKIPKKRKEYW